MAIIPDNHLLKGVTGRLGNFILKNVGGKTVMYSRPDHSNSPLSDKQLAARDRFKAAVAYAKAIIADPDKKQVYEKKAMKGETAYRFALKEFLQKHPLERL